MFSKRGQWQKNPALVQARKRFLACYLITGCLVKGFSASNNLR